jgi:hypothetical protein
MRCASLVTALLLAAIPCSAQPLEELRQRLTEREAEVQQLRAQIHRMEQQAREGASVAAPQSAAASETAQEEAEDINRALERALVRQGGLLLSRGTVELELNFAYSHLSQESTGFRRDSYGPGFAVRLGLPFNSQLSAAIPYVFEHRDTAAGSNDGSGIGDLALGLSHQFAYESDWMPNLIAGVGYRFGLGRNTVFTNQQAVAFGSGFNALLASLTATKRSDPLVFFGAYDYAHNFPDRKNGISFDVGDTHAFRVGALLATSPSTSMRVAFDLVFFEAVQVEGVGMGRTPDPLAALELGGSFLIGDATLIDLAIGAGLTSTAPDFRVTGAIPFRF